MDWPEFVGLVNRTGRYPAREMLLQMDAVAGAIGTAFGGSDNDAKRVRAELHRVAYPEDPTSTQQKIDHLKALEAENNGS